MRIIMRAAGAAAAAVGLLAIVSHAGAAGAFAIGACAAYGYAYDFKNEDAAKSAALQRCTGPDCKVVVNLRRDCAALAVDPHNACGPHGYASAARLGPAQNVALRQCYKFGGKDCMIRAWACDKKS